MDTNQITYYLGLFLGGAVVFALLALPVVLIVVAVRNYKSLKVEVNSYHKVVEAEDLEAARKRALDEHEEALLEAEMAAKKQAEEKDGQ